MRKLAATSLAVIFSVIFAAGAALAFGLGGSGTKFGKLGLAGDNGVPPPPLTNLRITNTGAFRITNTAANRAIRP